MCYGLLTGLAVGVFCGLAAAEAHVAYEVTADEEVFVYDKPKNGAGPLWAYGSTEIVRTGERVFVCQTETDLGREGPNRTRWILLERTADGWMRRAEASGTWQREPCPLAVWGDDLLLSVNPAVLPEEPWPDGHPAWTKCDPHLLRIDADTFETETIRPEWPEGCQWTHHTYRGMAPDPETGRLLLFHKDSPGLHNNVYKWALLDAAGRTLESGETAPTPLRACYPQMILRGPRAHALMVEDVGEPNEAWAQTKREHGHWLFVFRRLYYATTPKVGEPPFAQALVVEDVSAHGGQVLNKDLWVTDDGTAYILYARREVDSQALQEAFFPDADIEYSLWLAVVRDGAVQEKRLLLEGGDGASYSEGRLHVAPGGRLYVLAYGGGSEPANYLMRVAPTEQASAPVRLPLVRPLVWFCLATPRAGCAPSHTLDALGLTRGPGERGSARYVRIGLPQ